MDLDKSIEDIIKKYSSLLNSILSRMHPLNNNQPLDIDLSNVVDNKVIYEKGITNVFYIITVDYIPDDIKCKYSQERNNWALPQFNEYRKNGTFMNQECIYVGSSKDDINTRLRQHIGIIGGKDTSALHLLKWWPDAKIHIYLYQYQNESNDEKYIDALQTIEDTAWDICKPYFGKKGPRARKFTEGVSANEN